jgi:hypothetical protein
MLDLLGSDRNNTEFLANECLKELDIGNDGQLSKGTY